MHTTSHDPIDQPPTRTPHSIGPGARRRVRTVSKNVTCVSIALVTSLLAACGSGIPTNGTYAGSTPFGRFAINRPEGTRETYLSDVAEATADCMRDLGFGFPSDWPLENAMTSEMETLRRDVWIQTYGYGITASEVASWRLLASPAYLALANNFSDEEADVYNAALAGTEEDPGGCFEAAKQQSLGDLLELGQEFIEAYFRLELPDRRASEDGTTDAWSACMSEQGYEFSSATDLMIYVTEGNTMLTWGLEAQAVHEGDDLASQTDYLLGLTEPDATGTGADNLRIAQTSEIEAAVADEACIDLHGQSSARQIAKAQAEALKQHPEGAKILWLLGDVLRPR